MNKTLAAIIGIVILQVIALLKGVDGALLVSAVAVLGGLGGFSIKKRR